MGGATEHSQRHQVGRVELEEVPAQPLLGSPALVDEVVAMIDQQLDLPEALLVGPRPAQVRLSQRRPGDRERVDRVGLPARPSRPPLRHGQLRRHPHQFFADSQKLPFEPARELTAVLDRRQPLAVERGCPAEQLLATNLDRHLGQRPAASSTATAVTDLSGIRLATERLSERERTLTLAILAALVGVSWHPRLHQFPVTAGAHVGEGVRFSV